MSNCQGDIPVGTKINRPMKEFLDREQERCGVSRSELLRRILDDYRAGRDEKLQCPECNSTIMLEPCP